MLNFDLARKLAVQPVEKFILGSKLGTPVVAFDGHRGTQTITGHLQSLEIDV